MSLRLQVLARLGKNTRATCLVLALAPYACSPISALRSAARARPMKSTAPFS